MNEINPKPEYWVLSLSGGKDCGHRNPPLSHFEGGRKGPETATGKPRRVAVEHYTNHLAPSHEHPLFHRRTELLCFG